MKNKPAHSKKALEIQYVSSKQRSCMVAASWHLTRIRVTRCSAAEEKGKLLRHWPLCMLCYLSNREKIIEKSASVLGLARLNKLLHVSFVKVVTTGAIDIITSLLKPLYCKCEVLLTIKLLDRRYRWKTAHMPPIGMWFGNSACVRHLETALQRNLKTCQSISPSSARWDTGKTERG